ncbi:MAG: 1-deoxy-D-xylulose-5-phosphate reductoisomerase [Paludibacteraceae bacterium]|nr:1-deoxy-D-xylulose-5-phosphate reductoisomerase [Paludibacteraceae bacterium]
MVKRLAILGSTGSIGTQTLDIVRQYPDRFEVYALTAGNNVERLIKQAREFRPEVVCIADESQYSALKEGLNDLDIKVWCGAGAIADIVTFPSIDIVVTAMVGYAGLLPTIRAIEAGKTLALANKETLVVAGELITCLVKKHHTAILPVDSEHSAIFQSLAGEDMDSIERLLLTASGGPFRKHTQGMLEQVTAAEALRHPNWTMGAKITIDSATMMNKGFEVIEAHWLFGVGYDKIEVLVHPQSIVHSAVQFRDGAVKAQLGTPDMRLPILYALSYPERLATTLPRIDWSLSQQLTFEQPDLQRFPCLQLAFDAMQQAGNIPCAMNAANEVANLAFREGRCRFTDIPRIIEKTMAQTNFIKQPTYDDYVQTDLYAREKAQTMLV